MRFIKLFLLISIFVFVAFSCTQQDEYYTVEVIEGVRHVHNYKPQWGDESHSAGLTLEFVQKIGELESDDENYMFYHPRDVALDTEQNIYVLDGGNFRIQKFDTNGKYLATFGRRGPGPSEFFEPRAIDIDTKGNIYVTEIGNIGVKILKPDGRQHKSFRIFLSTAHALRALDSGNFILGEAPGLALSSIMRDFNQQAEDAFLIHIYDKDGSILRKFCEPLIEKVSGISYFNKANFFAVDSNNYIYVTFRYENRIDKYDADGTLIFRTDRPLDYKLKKMVIEKGMPKENPSNISDDLETDGKNRIWVKTIKTHEPQEWEFNIFDDSGILLGKLPFPSDILTRNMRIYDDRLFLVDFANKMCVYEYKIIEK